MSIGAGLLLAATVNSSRADALFNYPSCPNDNALCVWKVDNGWDQTYITTGRSTFVNNNYTWSGTTVGLNDDQSWVNDGTQYVRVYNVAGNQATATKPSGLNLCLSPDAYLGANTTIANKGEGNWWSASSAC